MIPDRGVEPTEALKMGIGFQKIDSFLDRVGPREYFVFIKNCQKNDAKLGLWPAIWGVKQPLEEFELDRATYRQHLSRPR